MISYFLPPLGGIASLRAWRFASLLPEFGWEPLLVAPGRGDYFEDRALHVPAHRVVRTRSLEISRAIRGPVRGVEAVASRSGRPRLLDRARNAVRRWVYRPDPQIGWYPFALAAARRLARRNDINVIFSSSFPVTAHLVGRRLHRDTGLPWVAEFRDLWSDWAVLGESRRRADEALERSLLAEAAAVATVSATYAEVLAARGASRVEVLTNAFDPEDFGEPAPREDTLAYLGTYYPGRQDVETALAAAGALVRSGAAPALRVKFIGDCPAALRPALQRAALLDRTEETGFVPHREAVRHLARARVLTFGGPVSCESPALRGNVAAKVFEYLGARRPILMVGHPDSDVARMLRSFPHVERVAPGDVEGARAALHRLWSREGPAGVDGLEPYTSRGVTGRLARLLDTLCA